MGQNTQVRFKLTLPTELRKWCPLIVHHFKYFVEPSFNLKIKKILNVSLLLLLLTVTLVWASEKLFTKLVEEFYPPVIKDFIGYVNKLSLIHI